MGRAGVRQGAGLLPVARRAVGLQQGQDRRGVPALWRAAFTAELLPLYLPEELAVVEPEKGGGTELIH